VSERAYGFDSHLGQFNFCGEIQLAKQKIKAVLFDLGDTLLNYGKLDPHEPFAQAARQTWTYLKEQGQTVSRYKWLYAARSLLAIRLRMIWSDITQQDFDSLVVLKKLGKKMGIQLNDQQYENLVWLWYEPLARLVTIEPDLHNTLSTLRSRGLKLGVLSNTFVSATALNRHIRQFGLIDFFDFIYYSYEFKKRKPHPEMFQAAIKKLGFEPGEIVFVGDRIKNDVQGSLGVGMIPVLKTTYANTNQQVPAGVIKINSIAELPRVVEQLNR
jgi:putative hydrolase of the HAD superfamily